ncbi:MAG: permease prefix domain 1-containing protein [Candidatus Methanoplasma sp.]|jgi:hypothetical protein|nr:permease prefix domain 1-containing protein [Candidatus Methanoplasma sp.]
MKEKVYVDRLFADYEDTQEIRDFKEEIVGNLKERVKELIEAGLDEDRAFEKATAELGDITAIADRMGKKRRNEAIGQMYIEKKVPLTKKTAAGLAVATGLFLSGVGLALITLFGNVDIDPFYYVGVALLSAACGMFAYSGLTQESIENYAMRRGQAAVYGVLSSIGVLGAGLAFLFFFNGMEVTIVQAAGFALFIMAICVSIYLLSTSDDRKKPWAKDHNGIMFEMAMGSDPDLECIDPAKAARFGMMSGGLWLFTIAAFIVLGLTVGWHPSWVIFLFAILVQIILASVMFRTAGG